jgi:WD40 repeat protein
LIWRLKDLVSQNSPEDLGDDPQGDFRPILDQELVEISGEDPIWEPRRTFFEEIHFSGRTGEEILIVLETDDIGSDSRLDTYIILEDENGQTIAENDDSFGSFDSTIGLVIPQDGIYRLIITTYEEGETGSALLSIKRTRPAAYITAHDYPINDVSFNHSGNVIATSGADGTIKLWDYFGSLLQTILGHSAAVNQISFSQDDQSFISAGDRTVRVWKLNQPNYRRLGAENIVFTNADIKTDLIVAREEYGYISIWNRQGQNLSDFFGSHEFYPTGDVVFSPDGQYLAFGHDDLEQDGYEVILWDILNRQPIILSGHDSSVFAVAFSPDGSLIASGDTNGRVLVRRFSGEVVYDSLRLEQSGQALAPGTKGISSLEFSRDGRILGVSLIDYETKAGNGLMSLWTLDENKINIMRGHTDTINRIRFHPAADYLVTASSDNTAKIWTYQGDLITVLEGHIGSVSDALFSKSGNVILTSSSDGTIRFWEWSPQSSDSRMIDELTGHNRDIHGLAMLADENVLVTFGNNGVLLWDLDLTRLLGNSCTLIADYMKNPQTQASHRQLCFDQENLESSQQEITFSLSAPTPGGYVLTHLQGFLKQWFGG